VLHPTRRLGWSWHADNADAELLGEAEDASEDHRSPRVVEHHPGHVCTASLLMSLVDRSNVEPVDVFDFD
jgi:hypothetical protein